MRVLVVAEYYPRAADPVRGVWAHRQALAARDAGAEVSVLVLHRPLPPLADARRGDLRAVRDAARTAAPRARSTASSRVRSATSRRPARWSYGSWGAWAAPALRRALTRAAGRFDLIHAHYAVPAGDAVRRAAPNSPLVVSVHGHDVYGAGSPDAGGADDARARAARARQQRGDRPPVRPSTERGRHGSSTSARTCPPGIAPPPAERRRSSPSGTWWRASDTRT